MLSGRPSCRADQQIDLVRIGSGVVDSTTTDASGRYSFTVVATRDASYQTRFDGSTSGVHPHSHVCAASTSRALLLKVRGAGGAVVGAGGGANVTGGAATALTGSDALPFGLLGFALLLVGGLAAIIAARSRRGRSSP